jgi:hypothetical protein
MTRYSKRNGKYHISGKTFSDLSGSRAQVWHGTAYKTSGGLTKNDLMKNKSGRIVSKSKHTTAKREKRLLKHGYGTRKGKFGFVKLNGSTRSRRSKRMKGGAPYGNDFSPASLSGSGIDGQGLTDYGNSSVNVQLAAGQAGGRRRKRGGAPYGNDFSPASLSGSGIDGQGLTDYGNSSVNVQLAAGQAGGRRRKHKNKWGGTTKNPVFQSPNNPLNRALGAS